MQRLTELIIRNRRFIVVFGGFLLHLSIGHIYTFGNMGIFIVQYLNNSSDKSVHINYGQSVWIFSLSVFGLGSSVTFGGYFASWIGQIKVICLGSFLMSGLVMLMYVLLDTNIYVISLFYGLLTGVSAGLVYGNVIGIACKWFPQNQGSVSGFIVSGFGLSAFIFDIIQSVFIHKYHYKEDPQNAIRTSFLVVGGIYFGLQIIGLVCLQIKPERDFISDGSTEYYSEAFTDKTNLTFRNQTNISNSSHMSSIDIRPHLLIMELDFWILWLTYTLVTACFILIISLHKSFGACLNISDNNYRLTIAAALGAIFNSIGRIFWGWLIDNHNYKKVMLTLTISLTLFLGTFYICTLTKNNYMPADTITLLVYMFWVMMLYFIPSGIFSIFPKVCVQLFGGGYFVGNYGVLFTAYSVGGLITSSVTTTIWQTYKNDCSKDDFSQNIGNNYNFLTAFLSGSGMALLAAILTLFYRGRSLLHNSNPF